MNLDQPDPIKTDGPDCWLLVIQDMEQWDKHAGDVVADMRARRQVGLERHGMPVTPDNGRNHLVDCYAELLDACVYLRAAIVQGVPVQGLYRFLLQSVVAAKRFMGETK